MKCIPAVLAAVSVCLMAPAGLAEEPQRSFDIGDPAPAWKLLAGTDGRLHSLSDIKSFSVVVVCFTCNSCPYSVDYEDRMVDLQKSFEAEGISAILVAINSNLIPADSMEKMTERAKEKQFNFAYLHDTTQEIARRYGAVYTPEFFVLNQKRELVYKGALDDSTRAEDVTANYVALAVKAALNGEMPETTKAGARGCAIRFKRRRR